MKKPELLSPAGNFESLKAAILAGCDAVYLGGKLFGARSYATNFSNPELIEAIEYAHIYGVKIYVTVNTLIFEKEVPQFLQYIEFLHKNNVDAVIIQDLGMIDLVHQTFPNLEIHASTQMHIHSMEGVKLAKQLGIKKVVLAREMDINQIKKIKKEIDIELEVFVHGALCISYSGQCLMSYFQGGRSGNRGSCAQCCRMPYDLIQNKKSINQEKYLLSTKDLCTIDHIGELIDSNIDSLKIEGRMKRPEYVYIVTKLYRMAIDQYIKTGSIHITNQDYEQLQKIFNRQFTKGFLFQEQNNQFTSSYRPNHMGIPIGKVIATNKQFITIQLHRDIKQGDGIRILNQKKDIGCILNKIYKNKKLINEAKKNDIISISLDGKVEINDIVIKTTDQDQIKQIKIELEQKKKKIPIQIELTCRCSQPLKMNLTDGKNNIDLISDYICEKPKTQPTTKEKIEKQINRLKDTAYEIKKLKIIMDEKVFIDIKKINEIRRQAIYLLDEKRCYQIPYKKETYKRNPSKRNYQEQLSVYLKDQNQMNQLSKEKITNVYSDVVNPKTIYRLPPIKQQFPKYQTPLLIGELGSLHCYSNVITDFSFNVTNSYTVALLDYLGAKKITLSYENTDENINQIITSYYKRYQTLPHLELIISSYPPVMITKFNLLKKYQLTKEAYIKDQKNHLFSLVDKNDYMVIYRIQKEQRLNYKKYYDMKVESLRIDFNDQDDLKFIKEISNYLENNKK